MFGCMFISSKMVMIHFTWYLVSMYINRCLFWRPYWIYFTSHICISPGDINITNVHHNSTPTIKVGSETQSALEVRHMTYFHDLLPDNVDVRAGNKVIELPFLLRILLTNPLIVHIGSGETLNLLFCQIARASCSMKKSIQVLCSMLHWLKQMWYTVDLFRKQIVIYVCVLSCCFRLSCRSDTGCYTGSNIHLQNQKKGDWGYILGQQRLPVIIPDPTEERLLFHCSHCWRLSHLQGRFT